MTLAAPTKVNRMILSALHALEKAAEADRSAATRQPACRRGKKVVAGHFDPSVAWQLRKLAVDRDTTVQKLLEEALHDLFGKYHLY